MNKVYILQDMKRLDYSKVEIFGDPIFIGQDDINSRFPIMGTPSNRHVVKTMLRSLQHFQNGDFLVVSGNPVMIALALHYLVALRGLSVILLKWDNRELDYNVIEYPGGVFDE